MTVSELLSELRRRGVVIRAEGERLRAQAPMGALTAELRSQLAARKTELLDFLRGATEHIAPPPIRPAPRDGPAPLSYAQERLWFLDQLEPGVAAYNIPGAVRLTGALDTTALERALNEIVRRHEALRTSFVSLDGKPAQIVDGAARLSLPLEDLRPFPEAEREAAASELMAEEARRPFALARAPLIRARLLQLDDEERILLFTMHHIVSDAWSMGVIVREMAALYRAFTLAEPAPPALLDDLDLQYADFALWQRDWLTGETLDAQLDYWRRRLAGAPPALNLPTDRRRPPIQSYRGAAQNFALPASTARSLIELSRREDATLFMTIQAAFQVLLARYSGQTDVVVGSPIANRHHAQTEGMVGFFVNMLALRTSLGGNPTFSELLSRAREVCLGAYAHQDLPFERLVETLQPERSLSRTPLFQVVVELQNAPKEVIELPGLKLSKMMRESGTAKFDLTLTMRESNGEIGGTLVYSADLFEASTIARMIRHFQTLLESLAADPHQRIATASLMDELETRELSAGLGQTKVEYHPSLCLHEIFEAQAARRPDAEAVACDGDRLSYDQLNRRANRLAHRLQSLGVGPESLVGLCLERSVELVVGALGILKAGGAYLPLDPQYPQERLAFMLEDSGAAALVTERRLVDRLPRRAAQVIYLDDEAEELSQLPDHDPASATTADNLAYVIYTSGSTGRPKGVQVSHCNVCRLMRQTEEWFGFDEQDVWTLFHSFAFDFSVWEMWGALLYGGRLVVVPYLVSRSPEAFHELLRLEGVTVLNQTPSAFRQLIAVDEAEADKRGLALRCVIFGGEALDFGSLRGWIERHGESHSRLVNMYGITETTVHVTYRPITKGDAEASLGSLIGGPIPDLRVYVLDEQMRLAPVGLVGELYVGGVGLARGYLNRPELTAERFLPDPFSKEAGARLYKSGDMARRRANGEIEYVGRADHQVKIRGFRIELGEIETALRSHPAVREAVVTVREFEGRGAQMAAYVAATPQQSPTPGELRKFLQARLPEYMTPAVWVVLDALPMTPGGKIDRQALPAPELAPAAPGDDFIAPATPVEERLAEIWRQVLGVERVGVNDNFFALGGDSIISLQIIARARQAGLRITPKQFYQHQTIAALAEVAELAPAGEAEQEVVVGPVPLTPIQHWFFERYVDAPHHWNQALMLETPADIDRAALGQSLDALLLHHDALRMRFTPDETGWRQRCADFGEATPIPLNVIDLSTFPESERLRRLAVAAEEAQSSLNLSKGPLVRAVLFDMGESHPGRLLLVIHHLVVDGVSWRVLLEDLHQGYEQALARQPITLPAKTTSFKRWAEISNEHTRSETTRREAGYWLKLARMGDAPLSVDTPGGENTEDSTDSVVIKLNAEETRALLQEVPAAYRTETNDLLLTALAQTLTRWAGGRAVLLDLEGHGREEVDARLDVSRTVGWFTTLYPVSLEVSGNDDPSRDLKLVKERLRAVPRRGIGYGWLRYLNDDAQLATQLRALPQAQVLFNYLGQFDQSIPANVLFRPTRESSGAWRWGATKRSYLLEISGAVAGGRLSLIWSYSRNAYQRASIESVAAEYKRALLALIEHCRSADANGFTPSDFPLAKLNQKQLDKLAKRAGRAGQVGRERVR